jgi:hypothetical protein
MSLMPKPPRANGGMRGGNHRRNIAAAGHAQLTRKWALGSEGRQSPCVPLL